MEGSTQTGGAGVLVVTGGGGIGMACARLLQTGRRTILAEASAERLDAAVSDLRAAGASVEGVLCDVSDPASVGELAAAAAAAGPLEALVHTAGLSRSMADARSILEVNLRGTALILDAFLPLARQDSCAVCVASAAGYRQGPERYAPLLLDASEAALDRLAEIEPRAEIPAQAYDLSKRGVRLMVESRAAEWGEHGARLVSVSPGVIDTEMGRLEASAASSRGGVMTKYSALHRVGKAEEVADVIGFLVSPAARYLSGCDIRVDGGGVAGMLRGAPADLRAAWNGWGALADT